MKEYRRQFLFTLVLVFAALSLTTVYNLVTNYNNSVAYIESLGESSLACECANIESYVQKGRDVLCVTADTVDFMLKYGASNDAILSYLEDETVKQQAKMDENFTGIYGYIGGEYLDGVGWVPPEDYDPKTRDWYMAAAEEPGVPVMVQPYLDAQTNTIMISVAHMLSDGESVVSLDIALNRIQTITENIKVGSVGYGFIIDDEGLIIAHFDVDEKGKVYPTDKEQEELCNRIMQKDSGVYKMYLSGEKCTVFTNTVMDEWHAVMVVSDTRLFHDVNVSTMLQASVSGLVFLLISVFCYFAYRRVVQYVKRDEENRSKLEKMNTDIVKSLAFTIDAKDRYTSGHSQRVADYSMELAKRLGKSAEEQNLIYYAGLLHDVGKIRVPEEVLNKPGKLNEEEYNQIKIHTVSGYHILKDIYDEPHIALGAKYHHERYDGHGYPDGLSGENIPDVAAIIGVADAYDAMASNRSYRNALPQDEIKNEIIRGRGSQFDPVVADEMLKLIDEDKDYEMRQLENAQKNILMIDDEPMNISSVKHILSDEPLYNVIGAGTFSEGWEILKNRSVDLVLLDLVMNDIDGFDAFVRIREKYSVPIVFTTADKNLEMIKRSVELGADDYITKPFLPIALKERIHGIIYSIKAV